MEVKIDRRKLAPARADPANSLMENRRPTATIAKRRPFQTKLTPAVTMAFPSDKNLQIYQVALVALRNIEPQDEREYLMWQAMEHLRMDLQLAKAVPPTLEGHAIAMTIGATPEEAIERAEKQIAQKLQEVEGLRELIEVARADH